MTSSEIIEIEKITTYLTELLNIPSPTGRCQPAIDWLKAKLTDLGLEAEETPKGGLLTMIAGQQPEPVRALTAHVDTLGAMVRQIKANGRLALRPIGSVIWSSFEAEGCTVFLRDGQQLRGSLLIDKASIHVHGKEAKGRERSDEHMELRLDERTASAEETKALGVSVGDYVAFDPRVELAENGFVRSRFLDDKAGVACLLASIESLLEAGLTPTCDTWFHFSNYEEVGHGAAADLPSDLTELVAVDMAAVGQGQSSSEFEVTICLMDSGGPYHHGFSNQLRSLAEDNGIPHQVDLYPSYRSDGSAHWFAGGSARVALLGPGIDASHHYERTHQEALQATTELLLAYLTANQ